MLLSRATAVVETFRQLRGSWHDATHRKSSGIVPGQEREEIRSVVGCLLALAHGNMDVIMIGPIDLTAQDGKHSSTRVHHACSDCCAGCSVGLI